MNKELIRNNCVNMFFCVKCKLIEFNSSNDLMMILNVFDKMCRLVEFFWIERLVFIWYGMLF